jgi:type II secretory pathway pseudopilin PulG
MSIRRKHTGFFSTEVIVSIAIVSFVMVLFTIAIGRQSKGSQRLNDSRAATLLAEQTMVALQSGSAAPNAPADAQLKVTALDTASAVKGLKWATVDAQVNGRSATLTGMVPAKSKLESGAK